GGDESWQGQVLVTAPDTDGVPTQVRKPVVVEAGKPQTIPLSVRVGQSRCPITVTLVAASEGVVAERRFYLGEHQTDGIPGGYPSTNRILLECGASLELEALISAELITEEHLATRVANVQNPLDLPTEWFDYESIETVLLTTSNPEVYDALSDSPKRLDALYRWVESGGQLFLFCGENAEQLIADEAVLQRFAPGRLDSMERLTQAQPLATFSGSEQAITRNRRLDLRVPSLVDVRGQILASAGRSDTSVPLVVRTRHGFGEVVFVGLDFDRKPLSDWPGRTSFLKRLFNWKDRDENQQTIEQRDTDDVISHLRNSLDKQFVGVGVIPFGLVALLAGAYVMLIGPGDYFFVGRLLKRHTLTWLTFPIIVIGFSAAAYSIAISIKGDELRVNQVEIVDVDCTDDDISCPVRGTVWTHFFSPQVSTLDLELESSCLGQSVSSTAQSLVTWLGLPGYSLGGMQANGTQSSVFETAYAYGDKLETLSQVPVQVWSTKTLNARWSAKLDPSLDFQMRQDGEELLSGTITNNTDIELTGCALLYGRWAYNLGRLPAGRTIAIDDSRQPRTVRTLLTNSTAGDQTVSRTSADGTVPFVIAQWDVTRLLKAMMFFRAINGTQYTNLTQRYQPFVDMSEQLATDDRAILLARVESGGSYWSDADAALSSDKDRRWTFYRFVMKVAGADQ
ncbi:MAG: hypothetical protein AAGD11_14235, partial [Planctomycetota bacterium]